MRHRMAFDVSSSDEEQRAISSHLLNTRNGCISLTSGGSNVIRYWRSRVALRKDNYKSNPVRRTQLGLLRSGRARGLDLGGRVRFLSTLEVGIQNDAEVEVLRLIR